MRTSRKAVVACLAGLLSVTCGLLALFTGSDLFLLGVVLFFVFALILGLLAWFEVGRSPDATTGKGLAACGMAAPAVGLVLGFLLLPAT